MKKLCFFITILCFTTSLHSMKRKKYPTKSINFGSPSTKSAYFHAHKNFFSASKIKKNQKTTYKSDIQKKYILKLKKQQSLPTIDIPKSRKKDHFNIKKGKTTPIITEKLEFNESGEWIEKIEISYAPKKFDSRKKLIAAYNTFNRAYYKIMLLKDY